MDADEVVPSHAEAASDDEDELYYDGEAFFELWMSMQPICRR